MSIGTDYSSAYTSASSAGAAGALGVGLIIFFVFSMIISLAISAIMIISMWKIFEKNGKQGWISLIPFYSQWVLFELVDLKGWLIFIPFANTIFYIIANYKLAIKMGKTQAIAIVTAIIPVVGYPMIAFIKDKSKETKVVTENSEKEEKSKDEKDQKEAK